MSQGFISLKNTLVKCAAFRFQAIFLLLPQPLHAQLRGDPQVDRQSWLGTAAGDLATEALGLGFRWGVLVFGALIALTWGGWRVGANAVLTFWIAYILTRPLGAALGDMLTQAKTYGGLGMGAALTSAIFFTVIVILVALAQWSVGRGIDAQIKR